MKNKDKVKKVHESKIGKIIYGFLMFMPLLAIGVTCLYTIFNKNAKDSYYGTTINERENIMISYEDLKNDKEYHYINNPLGTYQQVSFIDLYVHDFVLENSTIDYSLTNRIRAYNNNNSYYYALFNGATSLTYLNLSNSGFNMHFIFDYYVKSDSYSNTDNRNLLSYYEYNKYSYVSESFYYSIEQTENSNLFNWAKDSVIYTGMHDFTTQLNVSNTFIPMLLSYWLIVSIIYFLYDIALIMLNIVHRKIHELQDSL